jgi:hypothetical protein
VEATPAPAAVFLYSLALPGAGQFVLGQRRWALYLAAEALALGFFLDRHDRGGDLRNDYRDLAWETARSRVLPRSDPSGFEYYERLSKWSRSGVFDRDPETSGVQPETDPTTFNGSVWALAVRIFFPAGQPAGEYDPRYLSAVEYYGARAYPDALAWDWTGEQPAQHRFQELIEASDEAFRQATMAAALLLTNHVLSGTDAFVSARLRGISGGRLSGRLRVEPDPSGERWQLGVALSH